MTATPEVESGRVYNALWWAKVQSAGPQQVPADTPAVAGLTRASDGESVWLVPTLPTGTGHGVLDELGTPPVPVEQPNETARVLAICVACCWQDRGGSLWPGVAGSLAQVRAVYAGLRGRAEQSNDLTWIIGSLRRLHATRWILWDEKAGVVRLGPRVVTWGPQHQATLRELCRVLPTPPPADSATNAASSDPRATNPASPDPRAAIQSSADDLASGLPADPQAMDPRPTPALPENPPTGACQPDGSPATDAQPAATHPERPSTADPLDDLTHPEHFPAAGAQPEDSPAAGTQPEATSPSVRQAPSGEEAR